MVTVHDNALIAPGSKIGHYKGSSGSIRGLQVHPKLPLLASCGLDRWLRIHHTETRGLRIKVNSHASILKLADFPKAANELCSLFQR